MHETALPKLSGAAWRVSGAGERDRPVELWGLWVSDVHDAGCGEDPARMLLRQLVAARVGRPPAELTFTREPCPVCGRHRGRPVLDLPGARVEFSLSRSEDLVLVGLASAPIGVDIQAVAPSRVPDPILSLLHPAEREEILAVPSAEQELALVRLWTRKEAYLKGLGAGIAHGLAAEYLGTGRPSAMPPGWDVFELSVPEGYAAAAAIRR